MLRYWRIKKPPDPFPVASTAHFQSFQRFSLCFSNALSCAPATCPIAALSIPYSLVVLWSSTAPKVAIIPAFLCSPLYRDPLQLFRSRLGSNSAIICPVFKCVYDYDLDLPSSPSSSHTSSERDTLIVAWRISAGSGPMYTSDDYPTVVTLQIYDLASYGHRYYNLSALLVGSIFNCLQMMPWV